MTETSIPGLIKIVLDTADFPTIVGNSFYQDWLLQPGNAGKTFAECQASLKGDPGTGGVGAVKQIKALSYPPGATQAGAATPVYTQVSGVTATITPTSTTTKITIDVRGCNGITAEQIITQFTLKRKVGSVITDITPVGAGCLDSTRGYVTAMGPQDYTYPFSFVIQDTPGTTSLVEYQLWWKNFGGTTVIASLGKRYADTTIQRPTTIVLTEVE